MSKSKLNYLFIVGIVAIFLINSMALVAQTTKHSEEVTIVGAFDPKITKAFKINLNPKIKDNELNLPILSYYLTPIQLSNLFDLDPISPASIRGDRLSQLYKNLIKAGYGIYKTPFLEFFATNLRSDEFAFGVHLKHLSSTGKIAYHANSAYSNNLADVFGKRFYKNHTLSSRVLYKHNVVHQYGFSPALYPDDPYNDDDIKQRYQLAGANILFNSNYVETGKVNHSFGLNYYFLTDINQTREHNVNFISRFDNTFKFSNITQEQKLGLVINAEYYNNYDLQNTDNKLLISLKPYLQTDFEQYQFYAGINAVAEVDSVSNFHFYPELKAGVEIVPNALIASIGITGGFSENSFKKLSDINPYINSIIPFTYQNNKIEVFGQINGKVVQGVDFDIFISSASIDNMPFFVNDPSKVYKNTFDVVFDNVNLFNTRVTFSVQAKESIKILFKANYYNYTMSKEFRPWHKPEYDLTLSAKFSVMDIIFIRGEIINYGKSFVKDYSDSGFLIIPPVELEGWLDINLGIEYRYTKHLTIFTDFNNLGNSSYMRWYRYPVQKFSILGGLSYSF
ncbi:MAG: hypothetical protein GY834_04360 [Bacteroidetes bacterium]|nr:hypothetical protein [Bacteroidota bacterium]